MDIIVSIAKFVFASFICVVVILGTMKLIKWIWYNLIKKPIIVIIKFFKPDLKNIYDFVKWVFTLFRKKEGNVK